MQNIVHAGRPAGHNNSVLFLALLAGIPELVASCKPGAGACICKQHASDKQSIRNVREAPRRCW